MCIYKVRKEGERERFPNTQSGQALQSARDRGQEHTEAVCVLPGGPSLYPPPRLLLQTHTFAPFVVVGEQTKYNVLKSVISGQLSISVILSRGRHGELSEPWEQSSTCMRGGVGGAPAMKQRRRPRFASIYKHVLPCLAILQWIEPSPGVRGRPAATSLCHPH